ncbi:MAG: hypothetical protein J5824_01675 [Lachnospiraceae bacterium]|nr:hypothetical protein [Lachnospiraceae bacterium]
MKCKFCGREIEGQYDEYCGFFNAYNFGGTAEDEAAIEAHKKSAEYKASRMYHDVTIGAIKNISLKAVSYKYNESTKKMEKTGTVSLFEPGLDAEKCLDKMIKSKTWIAHFEGTQEIKVTFDFNGKTEIRFAMISPKPQEGVWYLYICFRKEFKIEIGLCIVPVNGGKEKTELLATIDLGSLIGDKNVQQESSIPTKDN